MTRSGKVLAVALALAATGLSGTLAMAPQASAHHASVAVSRDGGVAVASASGVNGGVASADASGGSGGSGGVAIASANGGSGNRVTAQPGVTVSVENGGTARARASSGRVVIGR